MSFDIRFDYRLDSAGWFTQNPMRRAALEDAATIWETLILDEFAEVPTGTSLSFANPETSQSVMVASDGPIDDVLIVAGTSRNLDGIAEGGPSAAFGPGSSLDRRYNGSNFEPWTGSITFNSSAAWFFDSSPATFGDVPNSSYDFIAAAVHEIGHVLGIGTSQAFANQVVGNRFTGINALLVTNGLPVPLVSSDASHVQDGFLGGNVMDRYADNVRVPTALDVAMLEDIGYQTRRTPADDYLASHPDLIRAFRYDLDAARSHYQNIGRAEGRATDTFDEAIYLASNPDLIEAYGYDLLKATEHYIRDGFAEGRPVNLFNPEIYLQNNSDLRAAFGRDLDAATRHFIQYGCHEGRDPLSGFDAAAYIASHRDLITLYGNNLDMGREHYRRFGRFEGRGITFEADDYLASHADLIRTFGNDLAAATTHYITNGAAQGRATDKFNELRYLFANPDLQASVGNDLEAATLHYINFGLSEGRFAA